MFKVMAKTHMVKSTERLNKSLGAIQNINGKTNAEILEEIIIPLAETLAKQKGNAIGYIVSIEKDALILKCYGFNVSSGILTSTLNDAIGLVD